ncbi:winged helix-turn-helix domain-containing protein [Rhizobium mesosinicum]|uniref:HNH endonuclease n=1 Tax=Rhizobium mesosinicum TaxID=335017 RepID=A0ABS7GQS7_9HYPH|nr:winged helix-turn-helix domain-containing protein [Rhizobium mesosinicum]MBW9052263.1 HNH endonuclease [Rhizobium mesosinicum]
MEGLPTQSATETALLVYLSEFGPKKANEVYEPLGEFFELSPSQLALTMPDGRNWWRNRVQWARRGLKDAGFLNPTQRGTWQLTQSGMRRALGEVLASSNNPEFEVEEGSPELKQHIQRERASALIAVFKAGLEKPQCAACDFNFLDFYGERGRGYIEAHHSIPISSTEFRGRTKLSDLIPLCANCHRMVHRRPYISVRALRESLFHDHHRQKAELPDAAPMIP